MRVTTGVELATTSGSVGIGITSPSCKLQVELSNTSAYSSSSSSADHVQIRTLQSTTTSGAYSSIRMVASSNSGTNNAVGIINLVSPTNGNNDSAFTFQLRDSSSVYAEKLRIKADGQVQFNTYGSGNNTGTVAQKLAVDSSGNIIETDVEKYLTTTGGTIDTGFTADDFRMLEIIGHANPNSAGSASYRDPIHIYVYNGVGWNGSAVTNYIYTVQIAPLAREVFTSGSSSSANVIEAVFLTGSTESDDCPNSSASSYQVRLKISNYGGNSYFQVKVIKRF